MTDTTVSDSPLTLPAPGRSLPWKPLAAATALLATAGLLYWAYMGYLAFWAITDLLRWILRVH